MRIAFVGKGGSGKTTTANLFAQHMYSKHPVLAIDADLNMHLGALLGFGSEFPADKILSRPDAVSAIKTYLKGRNERIRSLAEFRKTTPPTPQSNLIRLDNPSDPILCCYGLGDNRLRLITVGTYASDEIGASCYHNNLAIIENILSHLIDGHGIVVADMVAGVDAFANTLHAQFDLLCLVVEPTKRGIEVFAQYKVLAKEAGVWDSLYVVGNKARSETDIEFIRKNIPEDKLLGFFGESEYLRLADQRGDCVDLNFLEKENKELLDVIENKLMSVKTDANGRLRHLYDLHRRYVAQGFIKERFGDLTGQIDRSFDIDKYAENKI